MKKILLLFLIIISNACEKREVFNIYQKLNKTWDVIGIEENGKKYTPILPLQIINLAECKVSKKSSKIETLSCSGYINSLSKSTIAFRYTATETDLEIIEIFNRETLLGNTGSITSGLSNDEKYYKEILVGSWNYYLTDSTMLWQNQFDSKTLNFRINH